MDLHKLLDILNKEWIRVEEFKYDTPELLKRGQKITKIYPGDTFAKGYNFGFTKDPQKNIPIVMVIGWDQTKKV